MALISGRRRRGDDTDPVRTTPIRVHGVATDVGRRRPSRRTPAVWLLTTALVAAGALAALPSSAVGPETEVAPSPGTAAAVRSVDRTSATVRWAPATGASAVAGYAVDAVAAPDGAWEQVVVGKRISGGTATGTTLTGLVPAETYRVEVRALDAAGASGPPAVATLVTSSPPSPGSDDEAPTVTAAPGPSSFTAPVQVSLTSSDPAATVYWAKDVPALAGDVPSAASRLYSGPVTIDGTRTVELHWVVFDEDGHVRAGSAAYTYRRPDVPAPSAPRELAVTTDVPALSATVTWLPPETHPSTVTGYDVLLDGVAVPRASRTATSEVLSGLQPDRPYRVEVLAVGPAGSGPAVSASFSLPSSGGAPGAPRSVVATAGHQSATVTWAAPAGPPGAAVTRYDVQALDASGAPVGAVVPVGATSPLAARVDGLANEQEHRIRVTAVGPGGTASAVSDPVTPRDVITVDAAQFRVDRDEWRIDGRSRAPGSTITITAQIGADSVPLGSVVVRADGRWDLREQETPPSRRPAADTTVTVTSSTGATPVVSPVALRD